MEAPDSCKKSTGNNAFTGEKAPISTEGNRRLLRLVAGAGFALFLRPRGEYVSSDILGLGSAKRSDSDLVAKGCLPGDSLQTGRQKRTSHCWHIRPHQYDRISHLAHVVQKFQKLMDGGRGCELSHDCHPIIPLVCDSYECQNNVQSALPTNQKRVLRIEV